MSIAFRGTGESCPYDTGQRRVLHRPAAAPVRLVVVAILQTVFRLFIGPIRLGGNDAAVRGIHFDVRCPGVVGHFDVIDEPAVLVLEFGAAGPAAGMLLGGHDRLRQRDLGFREVDYRVVLRRARLLAVSEAAGSGNAGGHEECGNEDLAFHDLLLAIDGWRHDCLPRVQRWSNSLSRRLTTIAMTTVTRPGRGEICRLPAGRQMSTGANVMSQLQSMGEPGSERCVRAK